ncbi:MAG TPA: DUF6112 family protein [Acidimicrobiales bacterium]|nr:DUF6112 family protein [Acidimicrobiales bacterium]
MSDITAFLAAQAVEVERNTFGLPGIDELKTMVGALLTIALLAALAGLAIAAAVWAIGSHSANPGLVHRGKGGVLVSCGAAALAGGAVSLINFFAATGGRIR